MNNSYDLCSECTRSQSLGEPDRDVEAGNGNPAEKRAKILDEAKNCVCNGRNLQYGEPEDAFLMIGDIWSRYVAEKCIAVWNSDEGVACAKVEILPEDVAMLMVLLKVCRAATGTQITTDTLVDIAGYAACAESCKE